MKFNASSTWVTSRVKLGLRIGVDISIEALEKEYDALLWTIGCQKGYALPVENGDAPNCVSGVEFLKAYNQGYLQTTSPRVVCVGGGDTSIDVVSVARRLGKVDDLKPEQRSEHIIKSATAQNDDVVSRRKNNDVTLTSLFEKSKMMASEHEVEDALREGIKILDGVMPLKVILDDQGNACALQLAECDMEANKPIPKPGTEFEIECDLIVSAIGQTGDLSGLEMHWITAEI